MVTLEKRTEAATGSLISLLKKKEEAGTPLGDLTASVIIATDFSGSMNARYKNGEVQAAVERALALSLSGLDDDGTIQVFFFDDKTYPVEMVNQSNYQGFVDRWRSDHRMGGTNYGQTIQSIVDFAVQNQMLDKGKPPVFVIFITDGAPEDKSKTTKLLKSISDLPIFWQFLGLGGYNPEFLQNLDEMGGRVIDNVGLLQIADTLIMEDAAFFTEVVDEFFSSWLPRARQLGITQ